MKYTYSLTQEQDNAIAECLGVAYAIAKLHGSARTLRAVKIACGAVGIPLNDIDARMERVFSLIANKGDGRK